jgi:arylsulfatase A-like enzyme
VLIVVDALRPDHLGCYGYDRPTAPHIDSLAARGVLFETAISQAPWTKVSFPSFLTSRYPFQNKISDWDDILPDSVLTLAEFLNERGYDTGCVVQCAVLNPKFNILQGFDIVEPVMVWKEGARRVSDVAVRSLAELAEPFFLMVHFFDAHKPYRIPDEYVEMVRGGSDVEPYHWNKKDFHGTYEAPSAEEIAGNLLLYDAGIRYADYGIGEILRWLAGYDADDNTMIIVTADHGESFWEHGLPLHTTGVYDEALKVPLILHYPERWPVHKWIGGQVRLVDLFPTVADLVAGTIPEQCEGSSLLEFIEGGARTRPVGAFLPVDIALSECTTYQAPATRSLRTVEWKLICESLTNTFELYNLEEDPGETLNLFAGGLSMEDSLVALMQKVPGSRLRGWRLAFTGEEFEGAYRAELTLPAGGRFRDITVMTKVADVGMEIGEDSTSCTVENKGPGTHIVLIDTHPSVAPVRFAFKNTAEAGKIAFYTGGDGEHDIGETVTLTSEKAMGPPSHFERCRRQGIAAVHAWWLAGTRFAESGEKTTLTDEEKEKLKALGYIQ